MSYAQKNYSQKIGIAPQRYTIAEVGCFITAFSNLLERFGRGIDPAALNDQFVNRGLYTDIDDGVRDDVGYGSISGYDANVQVTRTGKGVPPNNNSIVKFIFTSARTGQVTTHFCLVQDTGTGTIVDSYDGLIKDWNLYGGPVEYATYADNAPTAPTPVPVNATATEVLLLPAVEAWSVYKLGSQNRKGTSDEVGTISPAKYPAARQYDVLDHPVPNVVTIRTRDFGLVNIYVAPETNAKIVPKVEPAPANYLERYTYARFENPIVLQTKIDANVWGFDFKNNSTARSNELLPAGTKFVAYGKATRSDLDNPVYFMREADFGGADATGSPASPQGVNTVDLEPFAAPAAPEQPTAPVEHEDGSVDIPVSVIPANPNKWQETFEATLAGVYFAIQTLVIHDIEGKNPDIQLYKNQNVDIGGSFTRDGVTYLRTKKSVENGWWYGIPMSAITLDDLDTDDDLFDLSLSGEIRQALGNKSFRDRLIVITATVTGFFTGIFSRFTKKK